MHLHYFHIESDETATQHVCTTETLPPIVCSYADLATFINGSTESASLHYFDKHNNEFDGSEYDSIADALYTLACPIPNGIATVYAVGQHIDNLGIHAIFVIAKHACTVQPYQAANVTLLLSERTGHSNITVMLPDESDGTFIHQMQIY